MIIRDFVYESVRFFEIQHQDINVKHLTIARVFLSFWEVKYRPNYCPNRTVKSKELINRSVSPYISFLILVRISAWTPKALWQSYYIISRSVKQNCLVDWLKKRKRLPWSIAQAVKIITLNIVSLFKGHLGKYSATTRPLDAYSLY